MAITYNKNLMGTITIKQGDNRFKLQIRQGNCLAVIIHSNKEPDDTFTHTLMQFFADEKHLEKTCQAVDKGEEKAPIFYDVKSIKLNMRYKECATLLKHLVKYYKITCYYK
jgi:hypothetical protein